MSSRKRGLPIFADQLDAFERGFWHWSLALWASGTKDWKSAPQPHTLQLKPARAETVRLNPARTCTWSTPLYGNVRIIRVFVETVAVIAA